MRVFRFAPIVACVVGCVCTAAHCQMATSGLSVTERQAADDDPGIVLELGSAMGWDVAGGAATFAPNVAAETTPVEGVLELEAGTSPFFARGRTEWDTDFLFKKPWTLSRTAEFMFGVGPEWVYVRTAGRSSNSFAGEVAGDFMFWPGSQHRFGWYVEPAYDYSFAGGHAQSVGVSAGLLLGLRRKHHSR